MRNESHPAEAGVGRLGLCSGCVYYPDYLNAHRCTPGDACIRAHSGRQIDRFLRTNPELAPNYLADLFWERRAIAARYAAVDAIFGLKSDPDEVVRRVVATRLPVDQLANMIGDPDREVRLSVAARLPEPLLVQLINDPDYLIRATVACRTASSPSWPRTRNAKCARSSPPACHPSRCTCWPATPSRKSVPSSPNAPCPASPRRCCRTRSGGCGWPPSAMPRANSCRR